MRTRAQQLECELAIERTVRNKLFEHVKESHRRILDLKDEIRREEQTDPSNADLPILPE